MLGLVGPPGAGKSTLALALQHAFAEVSQVVPMDGFHLANAELRRPGRTDRKGAPDTFDSLGFAALLKRCGSNVPMRSSMRRNFVARSRNPLPVPSPSSRKRA